MNISKTIFALTTAALMVGGCVKTSTSSTALMSTEPMSIDKAMQLRDWPLTTALYANGDSDTSSTGFAYEPDPDLEGWQYYFADPGVYFLNLVTSPYTLYQQRNGATSTGVQTPPTYTAMPPLPPSSAEAPVSMDMSVVPTTQP